MHIAAFKLPPLSSGRPSVQQIRLHPRLTAKPPLTHTESLKVIGEDCLEMSSATTHSIDKKRPRSNKSSQSNSSTRSRNSSHSIELLQRRRYAGGSGSGSGREELRLSMPAVTAKSWVLYEMRSGRQISGKRNYKKREMASLTKMMNLITVLEIMQREGLDPAKIRVMATKTACSVTGTTAELKVGAIYTLYDLLFGMMLPSGNDAAYLIAETCGWLLKLSKEDKLDPTIAYYEPTLRGLMQSNGQTAFYLREMNRLALRLQMVSSNFANPHGLSCTSNYSTAEDLAKLCIYSMKNPLFRSIVHTQMHPYICELTQSLVQDKENADPNAKEWKGVWQNTNKMLKQGWSGIKTGITPNAGPCLAASVTRTMGGQTYEFLVVLLNSESMQARWLQVQSLVNWAVDCKLYP